MDIPCLAKRWAFKEEIWCLFLSVGKGRYCWVRIKHLVFQFRRDAPMLMQTWGKVLSLATKVAARVWKLISLFLSHRYNVQDVLSWPWCLDFKIYSSFAAMFDMADLRSSWVRCDPEIVTWGLGGCYTENTRLLPPLLRFSFTKRWQDWCKCALACHGPCGKEEEYQDTTVLGGKK